jgi:PAS domain S-box-containing protein
MSDEKASNGKVRGRLTEVEAVAAALRKGQADAVVTERSVLLLRLKDAEEETKKLLKAIETTKEAICLLSPDLAITYANNAMCNLFGYKPQEMIGKHVSAFNAGPYPEVTAKRIVSTIEKQGWWEGEIVNKRKDGTEFTSYATVSAVKDKGGEIKSFVSTQHDITERIRAEEALQKSEQELTIRNRIADIFLTIPDDEIYGEILQVLLEVMESRYGIFGYIDEDRALVCPSMTRDIWDQCRVPDKTIVFPRDKWGGIWGRALIEKKTLYANEGLHVPEGHVPINRVLVVPIMYGGEAIGLLEVANKDTDYGEKDRQFLEGIADHIAPILNARLQRDRQQTQRRSVEEALRKSEKRYRELYEGSQDGYVLTDMKANIIEFNSAYKNMLGYPEKELLQKKYVDLTPPKWHSVEAEIIKEQILKKGYSEIYEKEYIRKDGTVFPIELRVYLVKDKKDKPIGMWAFIRDISERKEGEARQLLTEKILRCLNQDKPSLDLIVDILTLIKEATGFEAVGIRLREGDDFPYLAVQGFSAEFVQAENYLCARDEAGVRVFDSEGNPVLECMCGNVLSGRTNPSLPFFTEGGSFWTNSTTRLLASTSGQERLGRTRNRCNQAGYESMTLIPLRSGDRIVGLLQLNDKWPGRFTPEMVRFFEGIGASIGIALARIRAEEELLRSEERYALAQRAASIGSWDWDVPTGNLVWSEQIEPIFGFARGEFGGTFEAFLDCVHPEDRQYVIDSVSACLEESKYYAIEHRIVWPDKTVHWVSETGDVIRDESGKATRMLGIVQDITERKLVEQQIENLAKFPSENPYPVLRIAKDGTVLYANSAGSELLEEWKCHVGGRVPEHWHQYVSHVLERSLRRELETVCGDRIFSLTTAPVVDAGYVNVYGTDITERKQAEEDLRKYWQRLEELVRARTEELTEANKKLLEEIEQRKRLEKEILNISEREQRLIGEELHDSLGQQLTGVAFMTKVLEQKLAEKSLNEATDVAEIAKLVNQATDQARGLSKGLHPVDLDAGTLTSALFSNRCTFKYDKRVKIENPEVAIHLYRIAQEAITNAIRHGRAKHIQMDLDYGEGKSVLTVKNDGLDFPKEFEARGTGMGLQIMDHRVDIIGGSLDIRRAAEGGAILTCTFPNKKH